MEHKMKTVRFSPIIEYKHIASVGAGRPVKRSVKVSWIHGRSCNVEEASGGKSAVEVEVGREKSWRRGSTSWSVKKRRG